MVCRPGDYRFVGEVNSTFVNLDPEGELTQHLAIEFAMMPPVFAVSVVSVRRDSNKSHLSLSIFRSMFTPVLFFCRGRRKESNRRAKVSFMSGHDVFLTPASATCSGFCLLVHASPVFSLPVSTTRR